MKNYFNGFNRNTNSFLFELQFNNTIEKQSENLIKYKEYITKPINLLYLDLLDIVNQIDIPFETKPAKCISTPYTDRRFSPTVPLKEYMYLRFRVADKKKDILGLYFDMGSEMYGYGLKIYKPTGAGMELLREKIENHLSLASKYLDDLMEKGFEITGEIYKKDHYSELEDCAAKNLLNRKSFSISKSVPIKDMVYCSDLAGELSNAFMDLKDIFELLAKEESLGR